MEPRILHNIPPVYDSRSAVLILGSFPSVKSRETEFFYGHPRNRFWPLLAALRKEEVPLTTAEKKAFLLRNRIALWDVIESCEIHGSSDSSIRGAVPNRVERILSAAPITAVFTNGGVSGKLYDKYCLPITGKEAVKLPSTSPANAGASFSRLLDAWSCINEYLD